MNSNFRQVRIEENKKEYEAIKEIFKSTNLTADDKDILDFIENSKKAKEEFDAEKIVGRLARADKLIRTNYEKEVVKYKSLTLEEISKILTEESFGVLDRIKRLEEFNSVPKNTGNRIKITRGDSVIKEY